MKSREKLMTRIAETIVSRRWIIFALFVGLIVFSFFSFGWVHVEEDITACNPEKIADTKVLRTMVGGAWVNISK